LGWLSQFERALTVPDSSGTFRRKPKAEREEPA
jgi:hypothetical protein